MTDVARRLIDALVEAYEPFVRSRLRQQDLDAPPGLDQALGEGRAWLREALEELLGLPFPHQPRGPLEVFQEAMQFPTDVLADSGAPPVGRDEVAANALPGDLYGLAPASSSEISQEVWHLHLAWGAVKARAMTRPEA